MARRKGRFGGILEWKSDTITVTDTTAVNPTTGEFDLDLLPDEIAEVYAVDSTIAYAKAAEIDDTIDIRLYLSMDPDASASFISSDAVLEDLEVFFHHVFEATLELVGAGANLMFYPRSSNKYIAFPQPILVGTNFAQVVEAEITTDKNVDFLTTVYFKRRKASASELNQILLKRR